MGLAGFEWTNEIIPIQLELNSTAVKFPCPKTPPLPPRKSNKTDNSLSFKRHQNSIESAALSIPEWWTRCRIQILSSFIINRIAVGIQWLIDEAKVEQWFGWMANAPSTAHSHRVRHRLSITNPRRLHRTDWTPSGVKTLPPQTARMWCNNYFHSVRMATPSTAPCHKPICKLTLVFF